MGKKLILFFSFLTILAILAVGLISFTKSNQSSYSAYIPEVQTIPQSSAITLATDNVSDDYNILDVQLADVVQIEKLQEESPFIQINGNFPEFSDEEKSCTDAFEIYSDLDALGRCGTAYANICMELMPTEERGEIGQVKPSGWMQEKYEGIIDSNPPYLYNRCHLIGYQLTAENANANNLITGTRYLNVDGMLPFENMVAEYVQRTGNHVLYRVTPVFVGDELVCRGVSMEAWSVEDFGSGVCFFIFCPNVQPGVIIDYATGKSHINDDTSIFTRDSAILTPTSETSTESYVLNKNTMKYHLPNCSSVLDIGSKNRQDYTGSLSDLESQGYKACKKCIR